MTKPKTKPEFEPLDRIEQTHVTTIQAAHYLMHTPNRLRIWAREGNGPIKARKVGKKHVWSVAEIKQLLGLTQG